MRGRAPRNHMAHLHVQPPETYNIQISTRDLNLDDCDTTPRLKSCTW